MNAISRELPFDILCILFGCYADFDCRRSPLETLLLVCKSWNTGASSQSSIWSKFNIEISTIEDLFHWKACVPKRLTRSNNTLDIDVHISDIRYLHLGATFELLMVHLVGESGMIARRWRRFVFQDPFMRISTHILSRYLCFPTPQLEEFACSWLASDFPILPETSALKRLRITHLEIAQYPDLSNVMELEIGVALTQWDRGEFLHNRALALATKVETMKIKCLASLKLDATYTYLKALALHGSISTNCLTTFKAPNLTDLTLFVGDGEDYQRVVCCEGIDMGSLRKAHIIWRRYNQDYSTAEVADYIEGIRQFLVAAGNLETLELGDTNIACVVLKLLTDDCKWLYQAHNLHLVLGEYEMELGRGEGRLDSIKFFCKEAGCVYHACWDDTLEYIALTSRRT